MKNIHLLPTDKPSRLYLHSNNELQLRTNIIRTSEDYLGTNQNIYITSNIYIISDEEIKEGDWYYLPRTNSVYKCIEDPTELNLERRLGIAKIILTTDQDLIKDGVQAIDDKFLEWFVKNPSCEEAEINIGYLGMGGFVKSNEPISEDKIEYKIITPQEETKQYPIGGYAPGCYSCTCVTCKKEFTGDKRAVQCEPCAIEMVSIKIVENNGSCQKEEPKQETVEPVLAAGWIAVEKQLPEFGKPVLILTAYGKMDVCRLRLEDNQVIVWVNDMRPKHTNGSVIAWIGLPACG